MQDASALAHISRLSGPEIPAPVRWAICDLGVREAAGAADNPRVVQYHAATKGGEAPDAVAWCSSFVNWCWKQCGVEGTRTKRARDWIERPPPGFQVFHTHGSLTDARLGDVVVKSRGGNPNQGHVYFFFGHAAMKGHLGLGGNQNNEVSVQRYLNHQVVGYVRYVGGI